MLRAINNRCVGISSLKMKRKLGSICVDYMENMSKNARKCKKVKPESMTVTLQMLNANFCINVYSPFEKNLCNYISPHISPFPERFYFLWQLRLCWFHKKVFLTIEEFTFIYLVLTQNKLTLLRDHIKKTIKFTKIFLIDNFFSYSIFSYSHMFEISFMLNGFINQSIICFSFNAFKRCNIRPRW